MSTGICMNTGAGQLPRSSVRTVPWFSARGPITLLGVWVVQPGAPIQPGEPAHAQASIKSEASGMHTVADIWVLLSSRVWTLPLKQVIMAQVSCHHHHLHTPGSTKSLSLS